MRRIPVLVVMAVMVTLVPVAGQAPAVTAQALLQQPAIKAAFDAAQQNEARIIQEQVELCEIAAPPFKEAARAAVMKRKFEEAGLKNVRIDKVGNVIGERPGLAPRPNLVMAAHLDTVFPPETNVKTTRAGAVIRGPGIGDDCRGLVVLLGVARALDAGKVQTAGTITFVADVGEEGLGDLRGVRYLFNEGMKGQIDKFVSFDGSGFGIDHIAVGSFRYRVTFKGPGGHSFGAFGLVNPIHALGRAVAKIADFQVPTDPKVTFNVGRIGGGTSVNSIAYEAWLEMDMRSADAAALAVVQANFKKVIDQAVVEENKRWGKGTITVTNELVGDRPAGRTPRESAIVQAAVSVTTAMGFPVELGEGSTDSNLPISLGIPAITVGGGGKGSGAHSLDESFDPTDSWKGTQRAVLLAVVLSQK
jgi:tripeptide aminopeptidase